MMKLAWNITNSNLNTTEIRCFLITESLANDSIGLRYTLEQVSQVFGLSILKSIIVLVTKPDEINPIRLPERLAKIESICNEKGLPQLVWQNMENGQIISNKSSKFIQQCSKLNALMLKIVPYQLAATKDIEKAIEEKAKHLQVHGPKKKVSVPKQKVKEWIEEKIEQYTVMEPQQKTVKVWNGDLGKIFGVKKNKVIWENVPVPKSRVVKIPRQQVYTVDEDEFVPYDFAFYVEEARKSVLNEIRQKFKVN